MRRLGLQLGPLPVHAPRQRGAPGQARLDQHNFQIGNAFEHAFEDHADQQRLLRLRVADHLLQVE